jgi:hypothetical protein
MTQHHIIEKKNLTILHAMQQRAPTFELVPIYLPTHPTYLPIYQLLLLSTTRPRIVSIPADSNNNLHRMNFCFVTDLQQSEGHHEGWMDG